MLIYCIECEHRCSDRAAACPNCGCPLQAGVAKPIVAPMADPVPPPPSANRQDYWKTVKFFSTIGMVLGIGSCTAIIGISQSLGMFCAFIGVVGLLGWIVSRISLWFTSDRMPAVTLRSTTPSQSFHTKIVGVTHDNDDGSSRQRFIRKLRVGQRLKLIRDPGNGYDRNAIAVFDRRRQLGYLSRDLASQFAGVLDNGGDMACTVSDITGGGGRNYGCNVHISVCEA